VNLVLASGSLKSFLHARATGAPHSELERLKAAAMGERVASADVAPRVKQDHSEGNVIDFNRAKRSWAAYWDDYRF
jgi:hypothetical protein